MGKCFNWWMDSMVGIDVDLLYFKVIIEFWKIGVKSEVIDFVIVLFCEYYVGCFVVEML